MTDARTTFGFWVLGAIVCLAAVALFFVRWMLSRQRELDRERESLKQEIARRVKAEKERRASEERLAAMVTNLPVILFALDRFGTILLGQGKGLAQNFHEMVGRSAFEVFRGHPDLPRFLLRALGGTPVSSKVHLGERMYQLELLPARDDKGAVETVNGVALDITERMRAEEARGGLEQSFRSLIESAPDGILVHKDGVVLYGNPSALAMIGSEQPGELVGQPIASILPEGEDGEVALVTRGRTIAAEVVSIPVTFEGQAAMLSIARDVTARKETQARLMLADRMAQVGTLAGGVAHEINNPLSYIIANLDDAIAKLAKGPREVVHLLEVARQGADRVVKIVRDLRTFSAPEEGARGAVDVRGALDLALDVTANEIRHRAIVHRVYGEVPLVRALESQLAQVFINLLLNAAHAISEGRADANAIHVRARAEGGRAVVEIQDTGAGIAPENVRRLFAPFFTTKPGVGTGLGLYVCHNIVTALGGEIQVHSDVGKGTTVRVSLPGAGDARPAPAPEEVAAPPSDVRGRVLVVDDEALVATAIRRALQKEHEVVVAGGGRQALEILGHDERFDVIVCDLMMPDLTGMDLHAEIQRSRPGLERRMVFVSGGAFTPRAHDFLSSVPNPRLDKPFESARLRQVVREVAARSAAR